VKANRREVGRIEVWRSFKFSAFLPCFENSRSQVAFLAHRLLYSHFVLKRSAHLIAMPPRQKEIAMLVLTRKLDESIRIGDDIKITILRIKGNTIRLGIEAPRDVRVVRSELNLVLSADATQGESATITTIVDSPNASTPRLFVGKVSPDNAQVTLEESDLNATTGAHAESAVIPFGGQGASIGEAPLRAFVQSRGLTAV
jgi:carbon storage regulator CsrA